MLSNHCNVTGLLRLLQVNIQLFKIIKWTWRLPLKTGFAQISSRCPKNLSCPNFGGAAAPLAPPARTPMVVCRGRWVSTFVFVLFHLLSILLLTFVSCFFLWRKLDVFFSNKTNWKQRHTYTSPRPCRDELCDQTTLRPKPKTNL